MFNRKPQGSEINLSKSDPFPCAVLKRGWRPLPQHSITPFHPPAHPFIAASERDGASELFKMPDYCRKTHCDIAAPWTWDCSLWTWDYLSACSVGQPNVTISLTLIYQGSFPETFEHGRECVHPRMNTVRSEALDLLAAAVWKSALLGEMIILLRGTQ